MLRRLPLLLPAVLAALALPVAPALAGEDDGGDSASATLRAAQSCVSGDRASAKVTGSQIESVAFFVDGERVKTVTEPNSGDGFKFTMKCAELSVGAHRARAVVKFDEGSSKTLRFQITRSPSGTPRFAG
jgi:hypothetical protein